VSVPATAAEPTGALEKISGGLRGLAGRLGLGRAKAAGPDTLQ